MMNRLVSFICLSTLSSFANASVAQNNLNADTIACAVSVGTHKRVPLKTDESSASSTPTQSQLNLVVEDLEFLVLLDQSSDHWTGRALIKSSGKDQSDELAFVAFQGNAVELHALANGRRVVLSCR